MNKKIENEKTRMAVKNHLSAALTSTRDFHSDDELNALANEVIKIVAQTYDEDAVDEVKIAEEKAAKAADEKAANEKANAERDQKVAENKFTS